MPEELRMEVLRRYIDLQLFGDEPAKTGGFSSEYVQELRNENASWRTKLRDTEATLSKTQGLLDEANKKLGESEGRLKTFTDELRTAFKIEEAVKQEELIPKLKDLTSKSTVSVEKAQEALRKAAFMGSAIKAGVRKEALEDAYKLADFSSVKVDLESTSVFPVDKDGKQVQKDGKPVAGLDSLVETLVKEKSYLLGGNKPNTVGSPSNPGGGTGDKDDSEGVGTVLGKQQKGLSEQLSKHQSLYFPSK